VNDERCDLLCIDTQKMEAIREGLPGDEGAWVAAVVVMAVWRCGSL
jgi:hypothetical protein